MRYVLDYLGLELIYQLLELFVDLCQVLQIELHLRVQLGRGLREVARLALITVNVATGAGRSTGCADHTGHLILVAAGLLVIVLLKLFITFFVEELLLLVHNVVLAIVQVVEGTGAACLHQ